MVLKTTENPTRLEMRQLEASTSMRLPGVAGCASMRTAEHARLTYDARLLVISLQMMLGVRINAHGAI